MTIPCPVCGEPIDAEDAKALTAKPSKDEPPFAVQRMFDRDYYFSNRDEASRTVPMAVEK